MLLPFSIGPLTNRLGPLNETAHSAVQSGNRGEENSADIHLDKIVSGIDKADKYIKCTEAAKQMKPPMNAPRLVPMFDKHLPDYITNLDLDKSVPVERNQMYLDFLNETLQIIGFLQAQIHHFDQDLSKNISDIFSPAVVSTIESINQWQPTNQVFKLGFKSLAEEQEHFLSLMELIHKADVEIHKQINLVNKRLAVLNGVKGKMLIGLDDEDADSSVAENTYSGRLLINANVRFSAENFCSHIQFHSIAHRYREFMLAKIDSQSLRSTNSHVLRNTQQKIASLLFKYI